jgi:hypothetical protein
MATDRRAITATLASNPGFDRELPRLCLIRALLAGPIAERILANRRRARLTECDLVAAGVQDYENVFDQLDKLTPPGRSLLRQLEADVREVLERPAVWSTVERFAAVLLQRRSLGAEEATRILMRAGRQSGLVASPWRLGREEAVSGLVIAGAATWLISVMFDAPLLASLAIGTAAAVFVLSVLPSRSRADADPLASRAAGKKLASACDP